ncbi:hypothetical protein PYCCODRAFT_1433148 [Trametes coccinea BRFM310]|uniref:Uncharacterized protein n=1 Tax=Trametes coccinea (strain BRFM310) TaxID=1353009 RepID=A0A1Y2IUH5_TRAC3|nr:hypothetical protein PYCCODRAFT_1433148 [Trametes coccinea BRFM310]
MARLCWGTCLRAIIMLLARASVTTADLVNRTIDDQRGDSVTGAKPSWAPDNGWAQGQICGTCGINSALVDIDKVHDGTWLDSTYRPGQPDSVITASFAGTAVYVFNLIANSYGAIGTQTNLSFSIDGTYMGQYVHLPDPSSTILYNVCVFSTSTLPNQTHTLEMRATGPNGSLILFDYIVYTFDEPTTRQGSLGLSNLPGSIATGSTGSSVTSQPINLSSNAPPSTGTPGSAFTQGGAIPTQAGSTQGPSSHSVSMGVVAGGVAGGALLIAVAVAVALWYLCRRRRRTPVSIRRPRRAGSSAISRTPHSPHGEHSLSSDRTSLRHWLPLPPSPRPPPAGWTEGTSSGGEKPLAAAPPEPTHTDSIQVQPVASSADGAALSAVHSESVQPAAFDRDTSGSPLAPSVTREDPALQVSSDTPEHILRHVEALWQEIRRLRGQDVGQPTDDELPPHYDQLSER